MPRTGDHGRLIDLEGLTETSTIIAERIEMIAEAMRRIVAGRLKEETIIILIRESLPRGSKLSKEDIKAVLDAIKNLDKQYTRSP